MSHPKSSNTTDYSTVWQASIPEVAWGTIVLAMGIVVGYVLTISSVLSGHFSYLVACGICSVLTYASFTVMHDAGHGSIVRMGSRLKPLESFLGWLSSIPMLYAPYRYFTYMHAQHHAFTNDPDRDPDYFSCGEKWYQILANIFLITGQYAKIAATKLHSHKGMRDTYFSTIVYFVLMISTLVWFSVIGYGAEVLFLAVIPNIISAVFTYLFFDYIPHHPHKSRDRYKDTRIFPSRILNILLLGQNYHLIHHMYPRLPWYKYKGVYEKILPDLEKHGSPIENIGGGLRPKFMSSPNGASLNDGGKSLHMLLKVDAITRLTSDAVSVSFALPKGERLQYKAGQYITITKWVGNGQQTRCYSLCSTPNKGALEIGVRHTSKGLVSGFINQTLKVGDELIVQGPFGNFIYPSALSINTETLVLIAGGSGITPVLSILETALSQPNHRHIRLIYACRDTQSIMFFKHIQSLATAHSSTLTVNYIIENNPDNFGYTGRLNHEILDRLLRSLNADHVNDEDNLPAEFYICGPEGMKNSVVSGLALRNVPASHINIEEFVSTVTKPEGALHTMTVSLEGGVKHTFAVATNQSLLEVAKAKKVSLPHACSNGTCGSCKLRLNSGKVKPIPDSMAGITAKEQVNGFTLACQCYPLTDVAVSAT